MGLPDCQWLIRPSFRHWGGLRDEMLGKLPFLRALVGARAQRATSPRFSGAVPKVGIPWS
jgi:hypothetical protein